MTFTSRPDQDASPTILGYVYQAEVSILEWLGLSKGEALELELGEDLARFARDYSKGALTQVKKLAESLTLRRAYALKFLADSAYHDAHPANSDIDLSFIYLTTAGVGKEKGSALPNGAKGVQLWESIRRDGLDPAARAEALQALRSFLLQCNKPKRKVSAESWQAWETKLAAEEDLLHFCRKLRWSTGATEPETVTRQIIGKIVIEGLAAGPAAALELHRSLFVHVFRLLSQTGKKRLVREDLPIIATKQLLAAETALLERLEADCPPLKVLFNELRSEVKATHDSVKQVAQAVSDTQDQLVDVHEDVRKLVARSTAPADAGNAVQRLEVTNLVQQVQTAYRDHEGALDGLERFLVGKDVINTAGQEGQELERLKGELLTTTERFLNAHADAASNFLNGLFPRPEYREKLGGALCELVDDAFCREGPIQDRLEPRSESAYRDTIWKAYDRLQPLEIRDVTPAQGLEAWTIQSTRLNLNNPLPLALKGPIVEVAVHNRSASTIQACTVKAVLVEGLQEVQLPSVGANDIHPGNTAHFRLLLYGNDERGNRVVVFGPPTRPAATLPDLNGGHVLFPAPDRVELELRVFASDQPSLRRRFLIPFQ